MRILFVNSIRMFGGGEIWMLRTLGALQKLGHQVWLCCHPDTELERRATLENIAVKPVRFRTDFDPGNIATLASFMKRNRIEVVLTNMDKELRTAGVAAKLAGVLVVIPRRGIDYPLKDRWRYRFAYNVLATRILANSQATKQALLRNAPWLDAGRIEVIYNGIDVEVFEQPATTDLRKAWNIPAESIILGFVGQLDERKGISVLLKAFEGVIEKVPSARLVLVGRGQLETEVREAIRAHSWQECVVPAGFIADTRAIMQALDVLVLPSFWEGFGLVLIEAMAAGKPVITTNVSSMPEIVEDGHTGFLIPPGDANMLAARALELLGNADLRRSMGEAGRCRVIKQFTMEKMIQELQDLFARELARARSARRNAA